MPLWVHKVSETNTIDLAKESGGEIIFCVCCTLYRGMVTKNNGEGTENYGGRGAIRYAWLPQRRSPGYKEEKSEAEVWVKREGVEGRESAKFADKRVWRGLQPWGGGGGEVQEGIELLSNKLI